VKDASTTNLGTDGGDETGQGGQGNVPMSALGTPGCAKIQPFEFKVLEVCLEHTCKCMESEVNTSGLRPAVLCCRNLWFVKSIDY
jgi:hypothetical protein